MKYTVYKTINKVNGKYYIGLHQTKNLDDGYLGSGILLRRAIEKHGIENFSKEILHIFDNEQDMINKEKELIVISEETYNLCEGGKAAGFSYLNRTGKNVYGKNGQAGRGLENLEKYREKIRKPPQYCIVCETQLGTFAKKYCSKSCAAKMNNKGVSRNPKGKNQY